MGGEEAEEDDGATTWAGRKTVLRLTYKQSEISYSPGVLKTVLAMLLRRTVQEYNRECNEISRLLFFWWRQY